MRQYRQSLLLALLGCTALFSQIAMADALSESVKKDYITAYKWFYLAKENGNFHAEKRMQGMAEEHKLFPNQMKRAVELAKKNSN